MTIILGNTFRNSVSHIETNDTNTSTSNKHIVKESAIQIHDGNTFASSNVC